MPPVARGAFEGTVVLYDIREHQRRALLVRADEVAIVVTHDRAKWEEVGER